MSDAVRAALARAAVYRALAAAFAYPAPGHAAAVAQAAARAGAVAPMVVKAELERLASATIAADPDALAPLYVALFDGPAACPPYEGAYGERQLAGKAMQLADIAGFYAAFGMAAAGAQPDVEDHVGAELEFMAALALKEGWALAGGDAGAARIARDAQRAFLDDHLARWGDAFAARVLEAAPPGLYADAARALSAWLRAECACLAVVPRPLGGPTAADPEPFTCPMAEPTETR